MTLDEAISEYEFKADFYGGTLDVDKSRECARIAEWLSELKAARESALSEMQHMAQVVQENRALEAKNARLLALCSELYEDLMWLFKHRKNSAVKLNEGDLEKLKESMRDLGIEV